MPTNESANVISDRAISGDAAIPVDVGAVAISAAFTLNGSAFPASQYDGAKFSPAARGERGTDLPGDSHLTNDPVRVVPGNYHVSTTIELAPSPRSTRGRACKRTLPSRRTSSSRSTSSPARLPHVQPERQPVPEVRVQRRQLLHLRDETTGAESLLMNSHDAASSVMAIDGTYDVIYRHETGTPSPSTRRRSWSTTSC